MDNEQEFLFSDGAPASPPSDPASPPDTKGPPTNMDGPLKALMDENFLQYASYVIRDRAIPNLDDGLKPVQRRILFALHETDDGKFTKVANIVGYTMQFHPHGDASIGDALVSLANRQYLIEGQGNFGNLYTGDPAAAARYIECRLTALARAELFNDEITEFIPTYDGRKKEPVTLPSKLPLLLMLGAEGIAVGLATRILPHNFRELIEAQIAIIRRKSFQIYPDFPTGGVMDVSEYNQGNGRVRVRAVIETKDTHTLIIRQVPFGVTTEALIESIEDAARKRKVKIRSIHDFTAEKVEIEIQLNGEEKPERAIEALYAFTLCETPVSTKMVVIRNKRPVEMDVEQVLRYNTQRLIEILRKELELKRRHLREELHRLSLIRLFIEERIYKTIENCKTQEAVNKGVLEGIHRFRDRLTRDVTHEDVHMLLNLAIRRISLYDLNKNRADAEQVVKDIAETESHLKAVEPYTVKYLQRLLKEHGDAQPRKTRITTFGKVELRELTANELSIGIDRERGYLGYEINTERLLTCSSLDKLILVWRDGRYKMMPPPDKLYVGDDLLYAALFQRDKVMTCVYVHDEIAHMKKFTFGGAIQNKEYLCTPPDSVIALFADNQPEEIFVRYAPRKGQQIHQQIFNARDLSVRHVRSLGIQMTAKKISSISSTKPRHWDDKSKTPRGAYLNFTGKS